MVFETLRNIFAVFGAMFVVLALLLFVQHIVVRRRRDQSRSALERARAKVAAQPATSRYALYEGSLGAEAMVRLPDVPAWPCAGV